MRDPGVGDTCAEACPAGPAAGDGEKAGDVGEYADEEGANAGGTNPGAGGDEGEDTGERNVGTDGDSGSGGAALGGVCAAVAVALAVDVAGPGAGAGVEGAAAPVTDAAATRPPREQSDRHRASAMLREADNRPRGPPSVGGSLSARQARTNAASEADSSCEPDRASIPPCGDERPHNEAIFGAGLGEARPREGEAGAALCRGRNGDLGGEGGGLGGLRAEAAAPLSPALPPPLFSGVADALGTSAATSDGESCSGTGMSYHFSLGAAAVLSCCSGPPAATFPSSPPAWRAVADEPSPQPSCLPCSASRAAELMSPPVAPTPTVTGLSVSELDTWLALPIDATESRAGARGSAKVIGAPLAVVSPDERPATAWRERVRDP